MTAPVLADALGPRGRRRVRTASIGAGIALAAAAAYVIWRLAERDQLTADRWRPFTEWPLWRFLLGGLRNTVEVAVVAMVFAVVMGALLALARLARNRPVRWLAGLYVEFFRGMPLLLLILFSAFALPKYGVDVSIFWYLVFGLVAYNSAVLGEIFRAGILSLERGQFEAAYAVGLSYGQTMTLVIIPQAARRMIPAIVSQLVTLLKDTALGFVIGFEELLRRSQIAGEFHRNQLQALMVGAVIYILVNFSLSRLARRLEVRQRRRYGAGAIAVGGVEDLAVVSAEAEARL
jgi:glutamate transport system permease protein